MKKRFHISIPLGAITSFAIIIYMLQNNVWNLLSMPLKFLAVIGLILLFFFGEFEYTKETTDK